MQRVWQLQEAGKRLSEVVDEAVNDGPQIITRRGEEVAIVISSQHYRQLTTGRESLTAFFRASPLVGADLDLSRDKSATRGDVEL
jgi:antitoxin Phd